MRSWNELKACAQNGHFPRKKLLVGCDFDGTLAPFTPKPHQAKLPKEIRKLLERLARQKEIQVAVISGRQLKDVEKKVGLDRVIYCGNHGLEIKIKKQVWIHSQAAESAEVIQALSKRIKRGLHKFSGAELENKHLSLSLHYRRVRKKSDVKNLEIFLKKEMAPYNGRLRIVHGKKLFDVRPQIDWDKGDAILHLIKQLGASWKACFIGDDTTDEEAFSTLDRKALSIRVGPTKSTRAQFLVHNRGYVEQFLKLLVQRYDKQKHPSKSKKPVRVLRKT